MRASKESDPPMRQLDVRVGEPHLPVYVTIPALIELLPVTR